MGTGVELVDAAIDQLTRRWPEAGNGVAAAVRLDDGTILTSVGLDNFNAAVNLCAETGAICQAYTLDRRVTASACVARQGDDIVILAPCGVCRERLALWGPDVEVAVAAANAPNAWLMRPLGDLNPYYWAEQFTADGAWPAMDDHAG